MNDENKWSEISNDIANVTKQIKSKMNDENLVDDLKDTFKTTINNTSQLIANIVKTVEASVTDEDIKKETREIVKKINSELDSLLKKTKNKFTEVLDTELLSEEE